MKHNKIVAACLLVSQVIGADDVVTLEGVGIEDAPLQSVQAARFDSVSAEVILHQASAEMLNPYKAIASLPGVDIRTNDPFGMDITHKIRGKADRNIGETLEGLPLKGIGPGVGLATMIDIENVSSIEVEKGAIRADGGFGYGSDNGMVDLKLKKPSETLHVSAKQTLGSENFKKSYARVDSGDLGGIAKVFVSGSWTEADKFKGEGESPLRKNFALGIAGSADQPLEWELYAIYNDEKKHNYKGLSYEQSKDLSTYADLDYNTELTGDAATDSMYYGYNRQNFETYTVLGKIKIPLFEGASIALRPYFLNDKGTSYSGSGDKVIEWLVEHDTYGAVAEYEQKLEEATFKVGYWYQEDEPPGPPTSRKLRKPGSLDFIKWERILDVGENHIFSAPFATYEQRFGPVLINAGLKYLWLSSPKLISYNTAGIGDVSYSQALDEVSKVDFTLPSNTYEVFLPNLGASWFVDENSLIKANYGRNYNTPSYGFGGSMISYFSSAAVGKDQSVLQKMWADIRPEESDNFDLLYRFENRDLSVESTLFYSLVQNVGGTFYDPVLDYNYQQNTAEALSYGLELGAHYRVNDQLALHAAATYNHYAFTSDIRTATDVTIASKGNQLPDVPEFYANIAADYDVNGYVLSPALRYLGERYVDVENRYTVDPYYLLDFSVNKTFKLSAEHALDLSFSITNVLDETYISTVSTSETNVGQNKPTYIVGAPRAAFVSLQYRY